MVRLFVCHNFLKAGKLLFHAPIGALVVVVKPDLKTQGSVVFPPWATRGAPADGPRMNFVISMGLPNFFLDS